MQYREFGRTGVKVSALGFGAMRFPEYEKDGKWFIDEDKAIQMLHRAFDLGVNYVDSAYFYNHGNSERVVGKALKNYRDRVYVSTKLPTHMVKKQEDYRRFLEEQLKKLDTDHIDFYHFHGLNKSKWEEIVRKFNLVEEAEKAKAEGLIKHISFSFHDKPEVMMELADTGVFESVLCQYNLLDRTNEKAISYVKKKGLGIVIMGPVAGGRLAAPSEVIEKTLEGKVTSTPEVALRFVLRNPDVCCTLSGMTSVEMVEENARVASIEEPLSVEDWNRINRMLEETRKLAELYCTGCGYCMPCPSGIDIPDVFKAYNYHRVFGLTETAREEFKKFGNGDTNAKSPSVCTECGVCETKCPQNIKIRQQLKEAIAELG